MVQPVQGERLDHLHQSTGSIIPGVDMEVVVPRLRRPAQPMGRPVELLHRRLMLSWLK